MFTTARPQQCLQSHLHERLEVTASLPSAVLLGDKTQADTFTGDTSITGLQFQAVCQTGDCLRMFSGYINAYLLASCYHLLSDHLSSAAL